MTGIKFTHLHLHTPKGSLLDGFVRIPKVIEVAKEWGMDSIGISDHGSMGAHKEFYDQVKDAGLHPVLGMEAYITVDKSYKLAEFESIDYEIVYDEKTEKHRYVFSIVSKEEYESSNDLSLIENIKPKTKEKEMIKQRQEFIMEHILEKWDEDLAKPKVTALRKMAKQFIEDCESEGKVIALKGDATLQKYFEWFPRIGHLLLIAKTNEGYHNLLKLNNIGQFEGFYRKPRIDYSDIKKYGKGIVATTACLGSIPSRLILNGRLEEAKEHILMLQDCFDELFLEIQPSRQNDQLIVNKQLIEWSKELDIPLIATTDAHMISKEELPIHETFTNIGKKSAKSEAESGDNDISVYDTAYFMHPEEMIQFGIPREAIQNAYDLSHRCNVTVLDEKEWKFPVYNVPTGHDFDTFLEKLAIDGLFEFMLENDIDYQLYQKRLFYELDIIKKKNLSAYFVIVWDYINYAHKNGILVGPGRGE